ncbi:hypothetical protein CDD83_4696 [Cordyceps sp. RAO-2017]|nr:hypothetical protein CDD83_4696 [Cordyceps sp. RAO-2017]
MSGTPISNVAIAGAAGSLGSVLLDRLVSSGRFKVRVLRRNGSTSTLPPGVDVVDVDFDSPRSLEAALAGQHAVVSALGFPGLGLQRGLVDAAAAAGVRRFLPSEFGSDLSTPRARQLPVFAQKVEVADHLAAVAARSPSLTYTLVSNGPFLDWGLRHNFLLNHAEYKPTIFDGGDVVFSSTTLGSIADAVVAILSKPDETANRTVRIEDARVSQNKLLALAREALPDKPWQPQPASLDAATQRSDERLARGLLDLETFAPYIYRSFLDPSVGGLFRETDNELLGIKGKTDDEVAAIVRDALADK